MDYELAETVVYDEHFHEEGGRSWRWGGKGCEVYDWATYGSGFLSDRPPCTCPPGWPKLEAYLVGHSLGAKALRP